MCVALDERQLNSMLLFSRVYVTPAYSCRCIAQELKRSALENTQGGGASIGNTSGVNPGSSFGSSSGGRFGTAVVSPMMCYALRLRPGDELKGALAEFASERGIQVT